LMNYYDPMFDVMDPYSMAGYGYDIPYGGGSGYSMEDAYRKMGLNPPAQKPGYGAKIRQGIGKAEVALGLGETAAAQTKAIQGMLPQGPLPAKGGHVMKATRFAGNALKNPYLQAGLKWAGPVAAVASVGDVLLGDESLANKGMDAAFMTAGGVIGSAVPVVGTGLGIAAGKMISDGTQWLFGDKKTPEQRRMEEALAGLQQGIY
jgi:hypothetical protein